MQDCVIAAEAHGDQSPGGGGQNGDFQINGDGNGVDEDTFWTLSDWKLDTGEDFENSFDTLGDLLSARLILGLNTQGGEVNTDWVEIDEDDFGNIEEVQGLPANQIIDFRLNLLDYAEEGYTPEALVNLLVRNGGRIPFKYSDDAIVFFARLELKFMKSCSCILPPKAAWNNPGGGDFSVDGNWLELEVPGTDFDTVFDVGQQFTVSFGEGITNNTLVVNNGVQPTFDLGGNSYTLSGACGSSSTSVLVDGDGTLLTLQNGTLQAAKDMRIKRGSSTTLDAVEVTASASLAVNGSLIIGAPGGSSALTIRDGMVTNQQQTILAEESGDLGNITLFGNLASFTTPELILGQRGEGELSIEDDGSIEATKLTMAESGSARGIIDLDKGFIDTETLRMAVGSNTNAEVTLIGDPMDDGQMLVGDGEVGIRGEATIRIQADAELVSDKLRLGTEGSGKGTIRADSAAKLIGLQQLSIGVAGQGTIELSGGAVAEEIDQVSLAEERGSTGTLLLKDTATEFTAQSITVGNDGTGRFELQQEALGTLEEMLIGNRPNGTGVVLVDQGAGLSVQDLRLGADGMGTLTVTGMAQQISSEVGVGNFGFVGVKGEGTVKVEGGARFTGSSSVPLVLGLQTSGKGTLEVTGSGSTLDTFSTLTVGAQGEGTFTVGSRGVAQNIQTLRIAEKGEGAVDVTGSGSKLEAGVIEMGVDAQSGSATLTVQQQGWVEADALNMGVAPTLALADETSISDGTVKIKVGFIGREGRAHVRVENGGLLEVVPGNGILALGFDSQGSGTLEVDGLTSKVSANDIYVGVDGDGTVRITGGADLVARDLGIPLLDGAGEMFIDGAASLLLANHVYLGSLSTNSLGLLKLTNGGNASMQLLQVGALGTVDAMGGTLQVGQQTGPVTLDKTNQQDAVITTDTLFVAAGATLRADTLIFHPAGVLGGTYAWSFDLTNHGTIAPGDSTAGIGIFSVEANYTQTDTGILEIDLSGPAPGTEHDQLAVSGTATLAGTLRLHVAAGSSLEPGDRFEIVTAGALTGQFDQIESERAEVIVHYSETSAMVEILTVVSVEHDPSADPETEEEQGDAMPEAFVLEQNYPNPFNPQTTIAYQLPASQLVRLVVYDGLGREVERLVDQQQAAGRHEVVFEAAALPSGVYFYRLEAGTFRQTRRLILNK